MPTEAPGDTNAYARDADGGHLPAWKAFTRRVGEGGDVGIRHETFLVRDGEDEAVDNDMPPTGLGDGGEVVPAPGRAETAGGRLGRTAGDDAPADCAAETHPVMIDGSVLYVATNGDAVVRRDGTSTRLDADAPSDARPVRVDDGRYALYGGRTERYRHGALGDGVEESRLVVVDAASERAEASVTLDADLDGDGDAEIVTTVADATDGARIGAYDVDGTELATGPGCGSGWRHQLCVAPFAPDGWPELAVVRKPHVDRTLEFYRLDDDGLTVTATHGRYASHTYGSRNVDGGLAADLHGDGRSELLLPTADHRALAAVRRASGGVERAWTLPLGGNLATNVVGVALDDGRCRDDRRGPDLARVARDRVGRASTRWTDRGLLSPASNGGYGQEASGSRGAGGAVRTRRLWGERGRRHGVGGRARPAVVCRRLPDRRPRRTDRTGDGARSRVSPAQRRRHDRRIHPPRGVRAGHLDRAAGAVGPGRPRRGGRAGGDGHRHRDDRRRRAYQHDRLHPRSDALLPGVRRRLVSPHQGRVMTTGSRGLEAGERSPAKSRAEGPESQAADGTTAPTPAVAVDDLHKRFGTGPDAVTAVDGVSFAVDPGSVVGLLGPNGAGKTTLIKSILGMVVPDRGAVRIKGIDAREAPRAAYAHVDAMLEGARNDYWRLTVRENLRYFATISGVDPASVAGRHERLLDRLDIADKADEPVRNLSRGMKSKVSLASVLAGGAEVVFLDEPTLGLDVESARTFQAEIRRLAAETGLTVILSSHDMGVVETVCDRVIVVSAGEIVADDTVDGLLRQGDAHTVELTSPAFDRGLLATLRDRVDVTAVDRLDRGARIQVTTDTEGLYALMATLRDHDVSLSRVRTVERDLSDVLVDLTTAEVA